MPRSKVRSNQQPTHTVPSGMGGLFDVIVVGEGRHPGHSLVRVIARGTDWHGHELDVRNQDLRPLPAKAVR